MTHDAHEKLFRDGHQNIGFMDIPRVIEATMEAHKDDFSATPSLDDIIACDAWARQRVAELAEKPAPTLIL
jgi:1-deoxy-D-xylulose-5-phosphate reductoisomerase